MANNGNKTRIVLRFLAVVLTTFWVAGVDSVARAQEVTFDEARRVAFDGERERAREMLAQILEQRPNHWDARILRGRLFAWDKRYDEAREELLVVVRAKPGYADARNALVDVELWSDHPQRAIEYLEDGLRHDPNHEDFLYKKASALRKVGDLSAASVALDRLLDRNPSHQRASSMMSSLKVERATNKFGIGYGYTDVDTLSQPWHGASANLSRRTAIGSFTLRANWAERFGKRGQQFEIDAYPRIMNGVYAYVNYGYSSDSLFPKHRYAGELYANLPEGIELSAGFRRLEFANSDVTIYTGTIGKYLGSWWISFRPYVTPKSIGTSRSYALSVRRYFGNRDTFLGLTGGVGSSPTEISDVIDLERLDSRKVGAQLSWALGDFYVVKLSARYGREELLRSRMRHELSFSTGLTRRF